MSTPVIVNVGPHPATLKAPGIAKCYEVQSVYGWYDSSSTAGLGYLFALQCACIGLCWPVGLKWPATIPPRPYRLGESLLEWGEAIAEGLTGAGLQVAVISEAGRAAIGVCFDRLLSQEAVDAAKRNFTPPAASDSETSSASASGGTETSTGGTA